jgi:hypothetical protein
VAGETASGRATVVVVEACYYFACHCYYCSTCCFSFALALSKIDQLVLGEESDGDGGGGMKKKRKLARLSEAAVEGAEAARMVAQESDCRCSL